MFTGSGKFIKDRRALTNPIKIEIVSDPVCPWCYVGKRRLEAAISQRPELDIEVTWQPFQLSPDMPREGRNRRDYYRDKRKGGTDHYTALRCTAQRWVKIVYRMWHNRALYDEHYHQARRRDRVPGPKK